MVRKMKNMLKNNYRKAALVAGSASAAALTSGPVLALSAEQNTAIESGYTSVEVTIAAIIAALLGVILGIAGWSIIKGLLK